MAKTRAERRERRKVSARRRVEGHKKDSGSRYLRLPEGVNFFKVDKAGIRLIDVMPYIMKTDGRYADKGEPYWEKTFWTHRNVGPNGDMVICPNKTAGKKCPICEHRAAMTNNADADEDELKALAPKERQLFLVKDPKDVERGLQVWDVSSFLFGNLLESRIENADEDEEEEWDTFADLETGSTLRLTFAEKTLAGNKFYETTSIDLKRRKVQYSDSDLDENPCLDDLLVIRDYDDLKKLFLMVDDDDDDDAKPTRRRQKPVMNDDDDDDDDVLDDDEDEEPEPEPKKARSTKSTSKKAKPVVDDDDDDDDEDEAPPPKKATKPTKASTKKAKPFVDDDDDDDVWDDENDMTDDEEETPSPPVKTKSSKAKSKTKLPPPVDDDDDDDWVDDDDEDETPPPKAKSKAKPASKAKKKPAKDDDEWDDDWD